MVQELHAAGSGLGRTPLNGAVQQAPLDGARYSQAPSEPDGLPLRGPRMPLDGLVQQPWVLVDEPDGVPLDGSVQQAGLLQEGTVQQPWVLLDGPDGVPLDGSVQQAWVLLDGTVQGVPLN